MEKSNRANRFSTEVRARAVRMILEHEHEYSNPSAAIIAIAPKIGCGRDTLRRWIGDFTYVSTWQGFVYVAFIIDTFADKIVGPLSADLFNKSPAG